MLRTQTVRWTGLLVLIGCGVSGCVAWTDGTVRTFDAFPTADMEAAGGRPAAIGMEVDYKLVGVYYPNGYRQSKIDTLQGWAQDVFDRSRCFRWARNEEVPDYRLLLDVRHDARANFTLAVISGLTLTLFPVWDTNEYTMTARLVGPGGRELARREIEQKYTLVIEFFMLFGLPFAEYENVYRDMWRETFEDLAVWCHEEIRKREREMST